MQPTLNPPDRTFEDRILLDKLSVWGYKYRRGDVVVLRAPDRPNEFLVKRLIGLQGDWVSNPETQDMTRIPDGKCWVEGDNAAASSDSREYGAVPLALLEGRVSHILWPPQRIGRMQSRPPDPSRVVIRRPGM
ncbi:mitochondrial inner membrane protease subunit 2 [Klebsormidium nitens]|uniref:Mitochondrial inner membrane protease subunit 2 n=1 Tax=Klebsormidium nitens TaxID=105231 RepID=A0A1Y1I3H3_KLENI|nr:mitochondrial inner membrane protease subunit 2 [Klebsormidium nitens]|eukprot:GAQ83286.1 mitochondrial inner membrane protease subunit 2 [Klebsormidium nitens]